MSYQALYRQWRPETFSEISGQEAVTLTLKRQVESGRIGHAYLFCGTRGTGKTTAAKVLSRAINCLHPRQGDPCGECEICLALKRENSMDVIEIDAASNNSVDEIRDLREKIKYPPALTKYKVYIVDEVHMLSTGAFNALLKTLEEPPKHAVFILATTEPQKLPATILSRCQRFDFRRIAAGEIVERMMVVLGGIGRTATEDALAEIARAAEGSMRDALSLLDVCLSYTDGEVDLPLVRDALGSAGHGFVFEFAEAILEGDARRALLQIDELSRRGLDMQVFARDMTAHLRMLLLAQAAPEEAAQILEVTQEDAARLCEQAQEQPREKLERLMELFMRAEPEMKWAFNPRAVLELAAVRACRPEREKDNLEERLSRVEKALREGVRAAPAAAQEHKPAEKRPAAPAAQVKAPVASKAAPAEVPAEYLRAVEKLSEENVSIRQALREMRFVSLEDGALAVEFSKKQMMFLKILERKQAVLEAGFSEAFGRPIRLLMRLEEEKTASAAPVAGRVIAHSYDVFGRENIDLTD
ncbi:MAG TPA: DNA polymerase III subunit gamma/tau [Candidatus Pullichristensenella excrementigallinarum]|uniref:DNA-directed DNA polymerase n=1 Tax=Candidatus Pullichristensenella excrementigallinarum TaxID=2840907 RepID=A0A9D1LBQ6_9FIRM|nr:DNA polymerase III subunit gamma/tau [Candidatus Pullichristensenella excrementigallinarum]